jgi:hypothetical protein
MVLQTNALNAQVLALPSRYVERPTRREPRLDQTDGSRTRPTHNKPVNSRYPTKRNSLPDKSSGDATTRFAHVFAQSGQQQALDSPTPARPTDPDLARILKAWPTLPEHIRRAILALLGTAC